MTLVPLVSVIIPAYNHGRFIAEAIESVFAQDYPQGQIEVIVVDDGSVDDTREIVGRIAVSGDCRKAQTVKRKPNLKYLYQTNSGKAMAMKAGIEAAQGRYIFNLDADDLFLPGKINKVVGLFVRDGSITHVAHPVIYRYEASGRKTTERIPRVILDKRITGRKLLLDFYRRNKFYGLGSSFAARADILKKTPIQNRDIGYNVDLYLALYSLNAGNAFIIKEPLSIYRIHSGNYSVEDKGKRAIMDSLANVALKGAITALEFEDEVVFLQGIRAQSASLGADGLKGKRTLRQAAQAAKNCFNYYGISAKGLNVLCNYGIFKYMLKARII